MQALILGDLDDWRPYKRLEIDYETLVSKLDEFQGSASQYCKEIFDAIVSQSKSSYYSRPKASQQG